MSVNTQMTAVANAIRAKTGRTESLSLYTMAGAVSNIPLGIGADGESGTIRTGAGNYYGFSIPVTGTWSHLLVWPESITESMRTDYNERFILLYAVAGDGHIQGALDQAAGNPARGGSICWYNGAETNEGKVTFSSGAIDVVIAGGLWRSGSYCWHAW